MMDYETMDTGELLSLATMEKALANEGSPEARQVLDRILPVLRARGEDVSALEA
jgi:hypothetical protein